MTLKLANSKPPVRVKSFTGDTVFIGDYAIDLDDFLEAAEYVLTNTDLEKNDSRLIFVQRVRESDVAEGFNPGGARIVFPTPQDG